MSEVDPVDNYLQYKRVLQQAATLAERKRILELVEDEQKAWIEDTKMWNICERLRDGINKPQI